MKINKIDIPKSDPNKDGLENIKMDRLGAVVLVSGKNGSGKTRILNKIFAALNSKPPKSQIDAAKVQLEMNNRDVDIYKRSLFDFEEKLTKATNLIEVGKIETHIHNSKIELTRRLNQIANVESILNWNQIETSELSEKYSSIPFVPKSLVLKDSSVFAKNQIISFATNIDKVGVNNLPDGVFSKIQFIQDRWFNSTHQHSQTSEVEKKIAIDEYEKLKKIIEVFLNTSIGRTNDGEAELFGFPMGQSNLSDGQKILLQFCLAIYSQEAALKDLILILDEPENHLHPSVIIETIERIQKCVSNGQIWIATHSIPLLAHFDPNQLWFVENGKIVHAGKIPEKVLHSLLGDENEVAKLQDFISLPAQHASSRYAFECLFEPRSVFTGSNDPQSVQIRKGLLKLSLANKLRILDYGAGKGRLISNIVDIDANSQEKLIEGIDYIAYDKFTADKDQCISTLTKIYGDCEKRYFNDFGKLLSTYDKGSFDVVIMCNVLHEIDPKEWLKLFKKDGIVSGILGDKGILLLVEDHQIPIGEKAYQKGFLVLDTPQLKELFKISEKDVDFSFSDQNSDGRLKAHHIPKNCLVRIDESSKLAAIKSMSQTAREKILEIRDMEKNYHNGKLHGFWTQQFANAQLNLSELTTTS